MRKPLNRLLRPLGYEIVKLSRFTELLKARYRQARHFTFIQIGANDGVRFDRLYDFVNERDCSGMVVEPLPDFYESLRLNYRHRPSIRAIRAAVHPTLRKCKLYRVDPTRLHELPHWAAGIASLDPRHASKIGVSPDLLLEEEVDAMPLMEIVAQSGFDHLDLLQTDTEGFDAEVIRMIDFTKITPAIIKYEHSTLSPADQAAVAELLGQRGYKLFRELGDTIAVL